MKGYFVMPIEGMLKKNNCLEQVQIAHMREQDGFSDNWFDKIDTDE
jgi:hypothetical protein